MKKFSEQSGIKDKQSNAATLNYIVSSLYKVANDKTSDPKSMMLLVAATVMMTMEDEKATSAARRLIQLALGKTKEDREPTSDQ